MKKEKIEAQKMSNSNLSSLATAVIVLGTISCVYLIAALGEEGVAIGVSACLGGVITGASLNALSRISENILSMRLDLEELKDSLKTNKTGRVGNEELIEKESPVFKSTRV